jgi:hypothetical protein
MPQNENLQEEVSSDKMGMVRFRRIASNNALTQISRDLNNQVVAQQVENSLPVIYEPGTCNTNVNTSITRPLVGIQYGCGPDS